MGWLDRKETLLNQKSWFFHQCWSVFSNQIPNGVNPIHFIDTGKSYKGNHLVYFRLKQPTYFNGFPKKSAMGNKGYTVFMSPRNVKCVHFQDDSVTLDGLVSDLNYASYWDFFCETTLSDVYITNLNQKHK